MSRYEKNKWYYLMVVLFLNARIFLDVLKYLSKLLLPGIASYIDPIRNLIYILCFFYVIYLWLKYKMTKMDFWLVAFTIIFFFVSYSLQPGIHSIAFSGGLLLFTRVIPGIFFFEHLTNYKKILYIQEKLMPVVIGYALLAFFATQTEDYISLSYNLIPFSILYFILGIETNKISLIGGGALIFFINVLYGSRGSMLAGTIALSVYFISRMIRNSKKLKMSDFIIVALSLTVAILIFAYWDNIITLLFSKYSTSRTLYMLIRGKITSDSNRSYIYSAIRAQIKANPILPHGFFADRIVVSNAVGIPITYLAYSHNYFYEVLYQFGVPLGFILIGINIYLILNWVFKLKKFNQYYFAFSLPFIVITYSQLMLSSSYLTNYAWGISIGVLLNREVINRNERKLPKIGLGDYHEN